MHRKEISWTQVETGSAMKYSVILLGDSSIGGSYSALTTHAYQTDETKMVHLGKNSSKYHL